MDAFFRNARARNTHFEAKLNHSFAAQVATAVAHCRYVRREIRALDAEDRKRYLGALRAMATTPKAAGLAAYGSGFRTVGRRRGTRARETSLLSRPRSARVGRCLDARSSLGALSTRGCFLLERARAER